MGYERQGMRTAWKMRRKNNKRREGGGSKWDLIKEGKSIKRRVWYIGHSLIDRIGKYELNYGEAKATYTMTMIRTTARVERERKRGRFARAVVYYSLLLIVSSRRAVELDSGDCS